MAIYEFERKKTNINQAPVQITPLDANGHVLPTAQSIGLKFNRAGQTIARVNLQAGQKYRIHIWAYGDVGGSVIVGKRAHGSIGEFGPVDAVTIPNPPLGPRTAFGFLHFSMKDFTV